MGSVTGGGNRIKTALSSTRRLAMAASFRLTANRKVHPSIRVTGGAYEEDEAWAIVAFSFPHLFTAFERRAAEKTMKDSFPDAWEAITGNVLGAGESWTKDERAFFAQHRDDWIVIWAIICDHLNPASPK